MKNGQMYMLGTFRFGPKKRWLEVSLARCVTSWKSFCTVLCACMLSRFSRVRLFVTLLTVTCQDPLSMGFSRQEYWSGLPYHPPRDLSDPEIEPTSLISPALQADSLPTGAPGKPLYHVKKF